MAMLLQLGYVSVLRIFGSQVGNTLIQLRLQRLRKTLSHGKGAVSHLGHQPLAGSRARLIRCTAHPVKGFALFIQRFEGALIFQ